MQTTESGTLAQLQDYWLNQGWGLDTLNAFRMESETGGGGAPAAVESSQTNDGAGAGSGNNASNNGGQGPAPAEQDYSLASGFLERVPEEHRGIVEPYVKQWDAGVTRRFQELHSQFSPYEELGSDPDSLRQAMSLVEMIENDPWRVYGILHESLQGETPPWGQPPAANAQQQQQQTQQQQQGQQEQGLSEGGLPQAAQERFDKMEQVVTALAEHILGNQQQMTQQQEDQQLDEYLTNLHTEFGDFDDHYILTKVYQGMPPEQAIKEYNDGIQQRVQAQLQKNGGIPPILGGGGAPQGERSQVKDLDRNQTKSLVASVLAKTAQQRQ